MRRQLLPAIRMVAVLTVFLGLAYPLLVTGIAQGLFKDKANGSIVSVNGQAVGSSLIGQTFTSEQYFQGRPLGSSAGITATGSLDADGQSGDPSDLALSTSGGSNLGPTNPVLVGDCEPVPVVDENKDPVLDDEGNPVNELNPDGSQACDPNSVPQRVIAYRLANGLADDALVPVDAVTSSGSGLDAQISVANARIQAVRVARVRGLDVNEVQSLVDKYTDGRTLGFLGEPGVNVLQLNIALNQLSPLGS